MGDGAERSGPVTVVVLDAETGVELNRRTIKDDYCLVEHGRCYLDGIQRYGNGTTVLTLKMSPPEGEVE